MTTVAVVVTLCRAVGGANPPPPSVSGSPRLCCQRSASQRAFGVTVTLRLHRFDPPLSRLHGASLAGHTGARWRAWFLSSEIKKGG